MKKLGWSVCYGSSSSSPTLKKNTSSQHHNNNKEIGTTTTNNKQEDIAFFDSQPNWLDSDSDDFFSVNGDQTPSRSPQKKKKSLSDLFCESFDSRSSSSKLSSASSYLKAAVGITDQEDNTNKIEPGGVNNYKEKFGCLGIEELNKQQQVVVVDRRRKAISNNSQQHYCLPALMRSLSCSSSSEKKKQRSGTVTITNE